MAAITPMTELRAVNLILKNMGEAPVNSLTGALPLEASQAYDTLTEVSHEVQKPGWYFNTEIRKLVPDHAGQIYLPQNVLAVQTYGVSRSLKVTARGKKLYNITPYNTGYVFTGSVDVELVLGLEFDELPASARSYIGHRAARVMQVREVGDEMSLSEDNTDETRALAELTAEQLAAEPLTLLNSQGVYDVVSRRPSANLRLT